MMALEREAFVRNFHLLGPIPEFGNPQRGPVLEFYKASIS